MGTFRVELRFFARAQASPTSDLALFFIGKSAQRAIAFASALQTVMVDMILDTAHSPPVSEPVAPLDAPIQALPSGNDMATLIAAKLCHDFISPTGAIVSGLELMDDPSAADMHDEALNLIRASVTKLASIVAFARVAFGASTTAESFSTTELKALCEGMFAHVRGTLTWDIPEQVLGKPAARALLNLAYIAGSALPMGGIATLTLENEANEQIFSAHCAGNRARLKAEALTGLRGDALSEGLTGQWIQPYWLWSIVNEAGGILSFDVEPDQVRFRMTLPK